MGCKKECYKGYNLCCIECDELLNCPFPCEDLDNYEFTENCYFWKENLLDINELLNSELSEIEIETLICRYKIYNTILTIQQKLKMDKETFANYLQQDINIINKIEQGHNIGVHNLLQICNILNI